MCFTEDINKWGITKLFKCKSSLNFCLVHSKYLHLNFFFFLLLLQLLKWVVLSSGARDRETSLSALFPQSYCATMVTF